jgi:1-acyl-sn-glycerol-3-phosphate acyltransferase
MPVISSAAAARKPRLRVTLKSLRLIAHLLTGLLLCAYVAVDRNGRFYTREQLAARWHRALLKILQIRVVTRGKPAAGARILVANHVSWLDIPVIAIGEELRFVSKAEVREWPIAGWFAASCGTFFIRRGAGGTKQLTQAIGQYLHRGTVVFFPEGTTTDGRSVLKFQPRLFAAAIETGAAVQPVALRYSDAADGGNIGPFIGDDDLVSHILRLMKRAPLTVELTYCPPIDSRGSDRSALAQAAHTAICAVVAPGQLVGEGSVPAARQSLAA